MDNTHHLEIKKKKFLDGSAVMFPVSYTHPWRWSLNLLSIKYHPNLKHKNLETDIALVHVLMLYE